MTADSASRPRLTRAEGKENTHRLLLEAAERVFSRQGYQRATLDSIAAEAGFTKGAVYWHFRSKEDLFIQLLSEGLKRNISLLEMLASVGNELERLDEEIGRWIDQIGSRDNLPLLALEMELEARCNAPLLAQYNQVVIDHQRAVGRLLARYFEATGRQTLMPAEDLATSIFTLAKGIALTSQTRPSAKLTSPDLIRLLLGVPKAGTVSI